MRETLKTMARGEMPLPQAFWGAAGIYGTLLNGFTTLLSLGSLAAGASGLTVFALHMLALPYNLFVVYAVWRSAERYAGPAHWALLARIGVVIWAILATIL
jgi:hypothetical protein